MIYIDNFSYTYPMQNKKALSNINLKISEGEFVLVLGSSGSGKSTLAKAISGLVPEFHGGECEGDIKVHSKAAMVFQDPEKQLVMDTVKREVAFSSENTGASPLETNRRVMESLTFMRLEDLKHRNTYDLSGGQKQKTALCSALSMNRNLLILDEPTSQLDPVSAEDILSRVKKLNEDVGHTVVLVEQRVDRCFHLADRIIFMEDGKISFDGNKEDFLNFSEDFLPPITNFFKNFKQAKKPIISVKDARKLILKHRNCFKATSESTFNFGSKIIEIKNLCFSYNKEKQILNSISLDLFEGEVLCLLGPSGGGKSTLLKNITQLEKQSRGEILVDNTIGFLSQNPNDYLFSDTVLDELLYTMKLNNIKDISIAHNILKDLDIFKYRDVNPRDLSGGEKQRVALASVLVMNPDILILDEPTRGLDPINKNSLLKLIHKLKSQGKSMLIVTHDVEFAARISDRTALLYDGEIAAVGSSREILSSGVFYSTQISRAFSGILNDVCTNEDVVIS